MSTTSLTVVPRAIASLPSCDQSNQKTCPDLKLVNCLAGSPLRGKAKIFEAPTGTNPIALPSVDHRLGKPASSEILLIDPPLNGTSPVASFGFAPSASK